MKPLFSGRKLASKYFALWGKISDFFGKPNFEQNFLLKMSSLLDYFHKWACYKTD